jgi:hypothetical protein
MDPKIDANAYLVEISAALSAEEFDDEFGLDVEKVKLDESKCFLWDSAIESIERKRSHRRVTRQTTRINYHEFLAKPAVFVSKPPYAYRKRHRTRETTIVASGSSRPKVFEVEVEEIDEDEYPELKIVRSGLEDVVRTVYSSIADSDTCETIENRFNESRQILVAIEQEIIAAKKKKTETPTDS